MRSWSARVAVCLAGALVLGAGASSASGTLVKFDEFGAGFIDGTPLVFGVDEDQISHVIGLYYILPIPVVAGDVLLLEPPGQPPGEPPVYSDIIRFVPGTTTTTVFFFSDADFGETSGLADITHASMQQILLALQANTAVFREEVYSLESPEEWNGIKYTAIGGLPGQRQGPGADIQYDITSDVPPVPEPVTMAGLMLGIGGLVTYVRKRRAA
jgi:hypothetical protein